MAYFMQREEPGRQSGGGGEMRGGGGGRSMAGRPPPAPSPFVHEGSAGAGETPGSPLSRLVTNGYESRVRASSQPGFDAGVAQQWNSNVRETQAQHLQQNDPNYGLLKPAKTNGYRVAQAPGGGSSLNLGWDEAPGGGVAPVRRGRSASPLVTENSPGSYQSAGSGAPAYRTPSPGGACAGARRPGREANGGMAGVFGGGAHSQDPSTRGMRAPSPSGRGSAMTDAAYSSGQYAPQQQYSGGGGPAAPSYGGGGGGQARQSEQTSLAFGSQNHIGSSSNAYANGGNQNCGNGITDRRTTRVLQAPGGNSQISFG